jgi:hypothetical protein
MHGYIIVYHLIKFVTVSNSSTIGNHIFGCYFFGVFNEKKKNGRNEGWEEFHFLNEIHRLID